MAMSGAFDTRPFRGDYMDENVYFTSPLEYAWGIRDDDYRARLVRAANIWIVCGQGMWQERSLRDSWDLHRALEAKGIPHRFDIWGTDSEHDWPAWRWQIRHYVDLWTR
jgi:esterase/lipase superfamily enzyme